jgi:hypothetical protein
MKINYTSLQNMNETHTSFETIKRSVKLEDKKEFMSSKKTNKRKNNVVRGFKRIDWEVL